jgi:hypothetical protein
MALDDGRLPKGLTGTGPGSCRIRQRVTGDTSVTHKTETDPSAFVKFMIKFAGSTNILSLRSPHITRYRRD